jgi:hypothetical protein
MGMAQSNRREVRRFPVQTSPSDRSHIGLCCASNCPMLEAAVLVDWRPVRQRNSAGGGREVRVPFPPLNTMHRLIAKLMSLVFLAGTFAPLAGALAMPTMHAHCMRQPLGTRAESVSSCHHHDHAAAQERSAGLAAPTSSIRSNQCCSEHACCRSTVRSQWAQVRLNTQLLQADRAEDHVAFLQEQVRVSDLDTFRSVRAPPAL